MFKIEFGTLLPKRLKNTAEMNLADFEDFMDISDSDEETIIGAEADAEDIKAENEKIPRGFGI